MGTEATRRGELRAGLDRVAQLILADRPARLQELRRLFSLLGLSVPRLEASGLHTGLYSWSFQRLYLYEALGRGYLSADSVPEDSLGQSIEAFGAAFAGSVAVSSDRCVVAHDGRFGDWVYIPRLEAVSPVGGSSWRGTVELARDLAPELWNLLAFGAGTIVTLRNVGAAAETRSYTLSALPGTVFSDLHGDPLINAENLLHESAHSFLNQALAATGGLHPTSASWYSPWKGVERPTFAIIHSVFAFSVAVLWFRLFARTPNEVRPDRDDTAATHRRHLEQLRPTASEALAAIRDDSVRGLVRCCWDLAIEAP